MKLILLPSIFLMSIAACSVIGERVASPTAEPAGLAVFTPIPTLTSQPTRLPAIQPTSVPSYQPFSVRTWADNVALRKGPGYLFTRIGLLPKGTSLVVLGKSRGSEWALTQASDGRVGWVFVQLVDAGSGDWTLVPISEPLGSQLITGTVKDEAGVPISGIQFAVIQGSGSLAPRTDALTDDTGTFYAYLPADVHGQWHLGYTAVACASNLMDAACNYKNGVGGKPYPESQYITLPLDPQAALQFVWK